MSTAWFRISPGEGVLIRWVYGNKNAAELLLRLFPMSESLWQPANIIFTVGESPLYLFYSAVPGENDTEYLTITLEPGEYAIATAIVHLDAQSEFVLHRLRRL